MSALIRKVEIDNLRIESTEGESFEYNGKGVMVLRGAGNHVQSIEINLSVAGSEEGNAD